MRNSVRSSLSPAAEAARATQFADREEVRLTIDPYLRRMRSEELKRSARMAAHRGQRRGALPR